MAYIAFDEVLVTVSPSLSSPLYKEDVPVLSILVEVNSESIPTDVANVEMQLVRNQSDVVLSLSTEDNNGSTGKYSLTVPGGTILEAGSYEVKVRANSITSDLIDNSLTASAPAFEVSDRNQADSNNVLDDADYTSVTSDARPVWKTMTLSGAEMKRVLAASGSDMSTASGTMELNDLPAGAMLLGAALNVTEEFSGTGPVTAATMTLGANSSSFDELMAATDLMTIAESDVSASFVPNLAGGTALKSAVSLTGGNLEDLDDTGSVDVTWGYTAPQSTLPSV